ncbi:Uncharacterised protein [Salmonella enterica subsp. enterica]|uniref:DUF2461 domain-containing protein n=1 Tax=Salmonella enterica I TaxID=59201 RepID=A0A379X3S9_SALET|nr:Uncharacterised protein [Salmonella enterica subsp. enterica]
MSPSGHLHRRRVREWDNKLTIAMSKGKKMAGRFQGFAQEGLNFFQQVCIENDKAWFDEHRFIYERSLLTPFRALVDDLAPAMLKNRSTAGNPTRHR